MLPLGALPLNQSVTLALNYEAVTEPSLMLLKTLPAFKFPNICH